VFVPEFVSVFVPVFATPEPFGLEHGLGLEREHGLGLGLGLGLDRSNNCNDDGV
jgi:hypothetical protein